MISSDFLNVIDCAGSPTARTSSQAWRWAMIFPIGNRWSSGKSRLRRARLQLILVAFVLSGMVACFQSAASAAVDAAFLKNVSPADAQILIGQNAVDPSFIVLDVRTVLYTKFLLQCSRSNHP